MPVLDLGQVVGPQGPQGPKGDTGAQGNTGPQGVQGANGITPNIQVGTVTTLAPGSDAYFSRQEDSPDAAPVFDVGLPRGADSVNDGDMKAEMYDPTGKGEDIFAYTDEQAAAALASAKEYAYSKAQSLTAETAALYGKDATAVPDDIFSAIRPMITQTASGSYTGSGSVNGESNTKRISLPFSAKLFICMSDGYFNTGAVSPFYSTLVLFIAINTGAKAVGEEITYTSSSGSNQHASHVEITDSYIDFYNGDMNNSRATYLYLAIG